ncbi:MAG: hypothetical protein IMY73_03360 [Bacteroidetes bacterium]|nr:hypothetical protein [Bacteroidota bacterium]
MRRWCNMGQNDFLGMLKKRVEVLENGKKSLLGFTTETKKNYITSDFHKNIASDIDEFIFGKTTKMMIFAPP